MPFKRSEYFNSPYLPNSKELWKYMHIDKLLSLLSNKRLYFSNIYHYEDKYEGTLTTHSRKEVDKKSLLDNNTPIKLYEVIKKREEIENKYSNDKERADEMSKYSFEALLNVFSNHLMFCSCWFIKSEESHAMWAEYGGKIPTSIAIQTTVGDLKKSFDISGFHIHIGKVRYINYKKDHIKGYEEFASANLTDPVEVLKLFYAPVMHKRKIYSDEREVRAIISFKNIYEKYIKRDEIKEDDITNIPFFSKQFLDIDTYYNPIEDHDSNLPIDLREGEPVDININTLIQKVVIPPNANSYFEDPLKELLKHHGIDPIKVEKSKIPDNNRPVMRR